MSNRIRRMVPGKGGDSTLILGDEKTAVVDTGMTYCAVQLADKIEQELSGRPLDYIFLTHSHYDHAGGIPALRKRWPNVQVLGSEHARTVFQKESAQSAIRRLAKTAAEYYRCPAIDYRAEDLQVDRVIGDGDEISLGDRSVQVLYTPGHTNCSLSFYIPEESLIFPSESIGCYISEGMMESPFLTSFQATMQSISACRMKHASHIISPHYGLVTDTSPDAYFDLAEREAQAVREYLRKLIRQGMTPEQMLESSVQQFWERRGDVKDEQPLPAFLINMKATIQVVLREESGE